MVGGKLSNLRRGIPIHKNVTLGDGDNTVTVAVVALSADMMQHIDEQVEEYAQNFPTKVNQEVRAQYYNKLLCLHCMMDTSDPTYKTPIAADINEVGSELDLESISRIVNAYSELMINKAPKIEAMTQEQYEEVKKHLGVTPLSDLSTVLLVHLINCHQTIVSEK